MSGSQWDELAELALSRVRAAGVEYADIRLLDTTMRTISGEDRRFAHIRESTDRGFGIRVLHRGAWGFAASSIISLEEIPRVADLAVEIAKGSASLAITKVHLAPEPVHEDRIVTPCRLDPFAVALEEQTALLLNTMEVIQRSWSQSGTARIRATPRASAVASGMAMQCACGAACSKARPPPRHSSVSTPRAHSSRALAAFSVAMSGFSEALASAATVSAVPSIIMR